MTPPVALGVEPLRELEIALIEEIELDLARSTLLERPRSGRERTP
jgi:hypothetical protein